MMQRREFLRATAGAMALQAAPAAKRPNVLLILSDQLHYRALGAAGNPVIKTPNMDRLAAEGVRFQNAVCATPFCSPTRASLMTSLYPHKHGITYNVGPKNEGLSPKLPTTESILSANGYACGQKGKWHLGDKTAVPPYADEPELDYNEYLSATLGAKKKKAFPVHSVPVVEKALEKFDERDVAIGRTELPVQHSLDAWIADTSIKQLESLSANPFFMTVSFHAPHAPWTIAEPYYSMYDRSRIPLPENRGICEPADKKTGSRRFGELLGDEGLREYLAVYYGIVSMLDAQVGRVLDSLKKTGHDRDTLVILTADHGDMQAGHGMFGKTNFSIYEETTRVPLLMRLPGTIQAGRVVATQAGSCDMQPTILDYLGLKPNAGTHGRSLRSFIDGREERDRPIFNERERGPNNFQRTIRTLDWKYVYSSGGGSQLHNLQRDPGETRNLIEDASSAAVKRKLHGDLRRWMQETDDRHLNELPESV